MLDILLYILVILDIVIAISVIFGLILIIIIPKIKDIIESKKDNKK